MSNDGNRGVIERYVAALESGDFEAQARLRHADFVLDQPQTRERIVGRDRARAADEHYPGGLPKGTSRRVLGAEDRWIIDPFYAPRRISGAGDVWVIEATMRYPDQTLWAYAGIVELRDGQVIRETNYYAPITDAPAWRAQWAERMPEAG
jgi:hypothetical protein